MSDDPELVHDDVPATTRDGGHAHYDEELLETEAERHSKLHPEGEPHPPPARGLGQRIADLFRGGGSRSS